MPKRIPKPSPVLDLPAPTPEIDNWIVYGLDPSVSRTGYAFMRVRAEDGQIKARWEDVGSFKPSDTTAPVWVRSKQIAMCLSSKLTSHRPEIEDIPTTGLIISTEFPTPENDWLVSLQRIMHLVLFDCPGGPFPKDDYSVLANCFASIRVLTTNASTLRSLMGLKLRGAKNKVENKTKAYEFIDRDRYPNLDTDSCDAVLMAMMGRYAASFLLNVPGDPPPQFRLRMTDSSKETKGKGTRFRIVTKGLMHRPEYWYAYEPKVYDIGHTNARDKKHKLEHSQTVI